MGTLGLLLYWTENLILYETSTSNVKLYSHVWPLSAADKVFVNRNNLILQHRNTLAQYTVNNALGQIDIENNSICTRDNNVLIFLLRAKHSANEPLTQRNYSIK